MAVKPALAAAVCLLALAQVTAAAGHAGRPRRLLGAQQQRVCACPRIYAPVCDTEGGAHHNKCEAECKGKTTTGQRPINGVCNSGSSGPILASPDRVRPWSSRVNSSPTSNTDRPQAVVNPGSTTGSVNSPAAGSSDVQGSAPGTTQAGRPVRVCPCPLIYAPVCGSNGQTYPTKCAADCVGVSIASQGNC